MPITSDDVDSYSPGRGQRGGKSLNMLLKQVVADIAALANGQQGQQGQAIPSNMDGGQANRRA